MTLHTPNYAIPYPELTDTPDGATEMANAVTTIDTALAGVASTVTTNATRSTLLATLLGSATVRSNTQAGGITGTTSLTYVDMLVSAVQCATTFVSPPSGIVGLDFSAGMRSSVGTIAAIMSPQVRAGASIGAGTVILASGVKTAQSNAQVVTSTVGAFYELTGLTPGSTYNVVLQWKVTAAGSANGDNPHVRVTPRLV